MKHQFKVLSCLAMASVLNLACQKQQIQPNTQTEAHLLGRGATKAPTDQAVPKNNKSGKQGKPKFKQYKKGRTLTGALKKYYEQNPSALRLLITDTEKLVEKKERQYARINSEIRSLDARLTEAMLYKQKLVDGFKNDPNFQGQYKEDPTLSNATKTELAKKDLENTRQYIETTGPTEKDQLQKMLDKNVSETIDLELKLIEYKDFELELKTAKSGQIERSDALLPTFGDKN